MNQLRIGTLHFRNVVAQKNKQFYACNRLWLNCWLQHVDNLVGSDQLALLTNNTRNIKYNMVDWSIILCANNHKTGNGTGTGRCTVTSWCLHWNHLLICLCSYYPLKGVILYASPDKTIQKSTDVLRVDSIVQARDIVLEMCSTLPNIWSSDVFREVHGHIWGMWICEDSWGSSRIPTQSDF